MVGTTKLSLEVSDSRGPSQQWGLIWAAIATVGLLIGVIGLVRHDRAVAAQKKYMATVLATVNNETIRQSDVSKFSSLPAGQVLGILVDFKLLDQAAARQHVVISDAELQSRRQNMIASQHAANYAATASSVNRTELGLDTQLRHAAILETLAEAQVKPAPLSMLHACGIFIKVGGPHAASDPAAFKLASKLQSQLQAGASVAALANQYTDDSTSRKHNGDLGIVENAIPQPMGFDRDNKLFRALTSASLTGVIQGPIEGDHGYWAVKILSTAANPKADGPLYARMQAIWRSYWMQRLEPGIISQLRSNAAIEPPLATS